MLKMVPFNAEFNSAPNPSPLRPNPSLKPNPDGKNANIVLTFPTHVIPRKTIEAQLTD